MLLYKMRTGSGGYIYKPLLFAMASTSNAVQHFIRAWTKWPIWYFSSGSVLYTPSSASEICYQDILLWIRNHLGTEHKFLHFDGELELFTSFNLYLVFRFEPFRCCYIMYFYWHRRDENSFNFYFWESRKVKIKKKKNQLKKHLKML